MIKTIMATDIQNFEDQVNAFERLNSCFATQTHVLQLEGQKPLFVAVLFYKDKQDYNKG